MIRLFAAAALVAAAATPALAQDRAHGPLQVSEALKAGCSVQQVHVPAGKIGTAPAIVRCDAATQLARADRATKPTGTN
ncbi:hypothetical protein [Sphingomonas hengshuiensis]|uniref:Uncharacterized protein n=1 Tax=Sphingomonas hengshuiensis TaxID=1609977 RepID=A0A7U4LGD3_9SPHN|nr:hypothetical protein [Sphingomonas hengshuiensis]AJP73064.1 hypothetical protein TS85_16565 [Sphingomonas hengshuiensis]